MAGTGSNLVLTEISVQGLHHFLKLPEAGNVGILQLVDEIVDLRSDIELPVHGHTAGVQTAEHVHRGAHLILVMVVQGTGILDKV